MNIRHDKQSVTVTEAVRSFSDYINRVSYRHESFILRKGNKPVAELRPVPVGRHLSDLPSLFCTLPRLAENDAEVFEKDIMDARSELSKTEQNDPWAS